MSLDVHYVNVIQGTVVVELDGKRPWSIKIPEAPGKYTAYSRHFPGLAAEIDVLTEGFTLHVGPVAMQEASA